MSLTKITAKITVYTKDKLKVYVESYTEREVLDSEWDLINDFFKPMDISLKQAEELKINHLIVSFLENDMMSENSVVGAIAKYHPEKVRIKCEKG